ncbi:MAG: hypothetical protein WBA43_15905 [Elainellaceae cyanobacterium]
MVKLAQPLRHNWFQYSDRSLASSNTPSSLGHIQTIKKPGILSDRVHRPL